MATIQKRGNSYKITVSCGYDDCGKQIRKHTTWMPSAEMTQAQIKKELERQKVMFEEKCRSGCCISENIKFAELVAIWEKDYASIHLAPKTYERYRGLLKRILPQLGHLKISKIQPHHIIELYNYLTAETYTVKKCTATNEFIKFLNTFKVTQLSRLTDIAPSTIRDIKSKKTVTENTIKKLCQNIEYKGIAYEYTDIEK